MYTEIMVWDVFWAGASANGAYFFGLAFLSWVGLRISNNIYMFRLFFEFILFS